MDPGEQMVSLAETAYLGLLSPFLILGIYMYSVTAEGEIHL
jgi:hypothetical protein